MTKKDYLRMMCMEKNSPPFGLPSKPINSAHIVNLGWDKHCLTNSKPKAETAEAGGQAEDGAHVYPLFLRE